MKKSDMDFLVRFAAASSAAFLLSGCTSETERGPAPDSRKSAETQDSAASSSADQPAIRSLTVCLYGPPPRSTDQSSEAEGMKQNIDSVKLNAIYWNPKDPLVTIDDENYRTGDMVNSYRIIEIREAEVVFSSPQGEKVVKYFYDYL